MRVRKHGKTGPEPTGPEMVFGRCLVEGDLDATARARRTRRKTFGVSLAIEILLLGSLVVVPLLTSVAQPGLSRPTFIPFVIGGTHPKSGISHSARPVRQPSNYRDNPLLYVTNYVPREPHLLTESVGDTTAPGLDVFPGEPGSYVTPLEGLPPTGPVAPPDEIKHNTAKRPLRLSEPVVEAQLILRIEPRYPRLALQTRQSGTVVLHAVIGREGHINALQVVSGSPFFVQAALEAVRQWQYRPTLLDGEPVEVETTITAMFQLQR
jgi:periplasmic protein TonB